MLHDKFAIIQTGERIAVRMRLAGILGNWLLSGYDALVHLCDRPASRLTCSPMRKHTGAEAR
jgi:hypothetical protein